mmetsp:Transcript_17727/g.27416  ORF Transcript_17727/g.27416 Transcript_17727/m.27416 type:complete len:90 (-) Transcript_17727:87-356(-)
MRSGVPTVQTEGAKVLLGQAVTGSQQGKGMKGRRASWQQGDGAKGLREQGLQRRGPEVYLFISLMGLAAELGIDTKSMCGGPKTLRTLS